MIPHTTTPLGYANLEATWRLRVPPRRVTFLLSNRAGAQRDEIDARGFERHTIPRHRYRGDASLRSQLTFALKREDLDLNVLAALFENADALRELQAWLTATPASTYARIAAHLAHWIHGAQFDYRLPGGSARVRVLDAGRYVTGPEVSDTRFGVINNLLGTPAFAPLVRRTARLNGDLAGNLAAKVRRALNGVAPEMLVRAVDYLYLAETRSTWSLEREVPDNQRASAFRRLLEQAGKPGLLTEEQLCDWRNDIMARQLPEVSWRTRQNWLARPGRTRNIADYIPPAPADIPAMMDGVAAVAALGATGRVDAVIAAACASFGFVFVHPFFDGNGRLHRFLLHHILRQAGFTPEGIVLPLSARMLKNIPVYAGLLKDYSAPRTALLSYLLDEDSDTILIRSPQPRWLYAYFDATALCEYVFAAIEHCVDEDLTGELAYLDAHDRTVQRLSDWLDLPQSRLNNLIQLIVQNHGKLAKARRGRFATLSDDLIARAEAVVSEEFGLEPVAPPASR